MRKKFSEWLEDRRIVIGPAASEYGDVTQGAFLIERGSSTIRVVASTGHNWDHVSVSLVDRCPTWEEMCIVKDLFFDEEECVVQYHPPKSRYVNIHPFCLHLWRPHDTIFPVPPVWMV